jgi:glutathione S-transferase
MRGNPQDLGRIDRTEAYLKINPLGRVPVLCLDNGEPLTQNTAILPYLGKRFGLWPTEARALSVHRAHHFLDAGKRGRVGGVPFCPADRDSRPSTAI